MYNTNNITKFEESSDAEKVEAIRRTAVEIAKAARPVVDAIVKEFVDLGMVVNLVFGKISADKYNKYYARLNKKEKHRKKNTERNTKG